MRSILVLFFTLTLFACNTGNDQAKLESQIEKAEQQLQKDADENNFDRKNALRAAKAYTSYVNEFPEDTLKNPLYMSKAAQLFASAEVYDSSIIWINKLIYTYPNTDFAANMMHYKAFIVYEDGLKDLVKAEETYLKFLDKYPQHPLYTSVLFSLENLHKQDKDLLEMVRQFKANEEAEE